MEGRKSRRSNVKVEKWRSWSCFKRTFLFSTKCMLVKLTSSLRHNTRGSNHGLMSLYKDMESCGEYTDIKVMWEMIHSLYHPKVHNNRSKRPYWIFCFRPT